MPERFRRVITGRREDGRSVIVTDDTVGFGALGAADFFKTTAAPASLTANDQLDAGGRSALDPPPNGTIFRFFEIPPERPLADEIQLAPFDVVVQRATNHYWINHGDEPALLVGVLLDAR